MFGRSMSQPVLCSSLDCTRSPSRVWEELHHGTWSDWKMAPIVNSAPILVTPHKETHLPTENSTENRTARHWYAVY